MLRDSLHEPSINYSLNYSLVVYYSTSFGIINWVCQFINSYLLKTSWGSSEIHISLQFTFLLFVINCFKIQLEKYSKKPKNGPEATLLGNKVKIDMYIDALFFINAWFLPFRPFKKTDFFTSLIMRKLRCQVSIWIQAKKRSWRVKIIACIEQFNKTDGAYAHEEF